MFGKGKERERAWSAFEAEAMPLMPDIFRIAYWMCGDRAVAEDMTQDTYYQALKSFHGYSQGTNIRAWLTTILYRVNGRRRAALGRLKLVEDSEEQIAETVAFEPPVPAGLTDEDVIDAMRRVPEKFRDVILLADVEEFSYKETAEMLEVPIGTVMSRLHRGRAILRQSLAGFASGYGLSAEG